MGNYELSPSGLKFVTSLAGKATRFSAASLIPTEVRRWFHNYSNPLTQELVFVVNDPPTSASMLTHRFDPGHRTGPYTYPHGNEDWKIATQVSPSGFEVKLVRYSASHILPCSSSSPAGPIPDFSMPQGSQADLAELFTNRPDLKRD